MAIEKVKTGRLLYHLTDINNLNSILEYGLASRRIILEENVVFDDIADAGIINKRTQLGIDHMVPFHFHPYSAFDTAVKNTYKDRNFIYITITRELAEYNEFKIIPTHPLSLTKLEMYDYNEGFEIIDWNSMHTYGNETDYIKNVKMAECLTEKLIPAKHFRVIYVKDEETKNYVEKILRDFGITEHPPYVNIMNVWFEVN